MIWRMLFFSCVLVGASLDEICEDPRCNCTEKVVSCSCLGSQKQKFTLEDTQLNRNLEIFEIHNCGDVSIRDQNFRNITHSLTRQILTVSLKDINNLKFTQKPFYETDTQTLKMENIGSIQMEEGEISMSLTINQVILMKNVSSKFLPTHFVSGLALSEILIENCHFGKLAEEAFTFMNLNRLVVKGNRFETMEKNSFLHFALFGPDGVGEVIFVNNTISDAKSFSLELGKVNNMTFGDCKFSTLHWSFLKAEPQIFEFNGNEIDIADNGAFIHLKVTKSVEFVGNRFKMAETHSLPDVRRCPQVVVEGNSFICDCDLAWMWLGDKVHEVFFTSSTCEDGSNLTSVNLDNSALRECLGVKSLNSDPISASRVNQRSICDSGFVHSQWFAVILFALVFLLIVATILVVRKCGFPTDCLRKKRGILDMDQSDQEAVNGL